ncbi:hypothetical protein NDU88_000934 [Pleurodeles waltl]|uniref:Uncharacterized protein n=1 Tax=Pleurodeles waltl TaxID=8319 RepID=A0AAV7P5B7_PLEWA|nr:hypothetical protein NDU88_000934 [Pleurodeles waltl]
MGLNHNLYHVHRNGKRGKHWKEVLPCLNRSLLRAQCLDLLLSHLVVYRRCEFMCDPVAWAESWEPVCGFLVGASMLDVEMHSRTARAGSAPGTGIAGALLCGSNKRCYERVSGAGGVPLERFYFFLETHPARQRDPKLQPIESSRIPSAVKSRKYDALGDIYTGIGNGSSLDTGYHGGGFMKLPPFSSRKAPVAEGAGALDNEVSPQKIRPVLPWRPVCCWELLVVSPETQ